MISDYLHSSKLPGGGKNQQVCNFDKPPAPGKVCEMNVKELKECSQIQGYSYNRSSPCVFIKLNRIYDWMPEFYNDPADLPKNMPEDLKEHIASLPAASVSIHIVQSNASNSHDMQVLRLDYVHSFREIKFGFHAKDRIQLIVKLLAILHITLDEDYQSIIIHLPMYKAI